MALPNKRDNSLLAIYRVSRKDKLRGHSVSSTSCQHADLGSTVQLKASGLVGTLSSMNFVNAWRETSDFGQTPEGVDTNSSALDTNTLKWKTWCSTASHGNHSVSAELNSLNDHIYTPSVMDTLNQPLFHFTNTEFRRLTDQLRDVSWNLSNRFKGLGFNRFKGAAADEGNSACLYRSQLAVSNKAFSDTQTWKPYIHSRPETSNSRCRPESSNSRCRPVNRIVDDRERRPRTAIPSSRSRPKSSNISNSQTAQDVTWGDYDMLTADIVTELQHDQDTGIESKFGEKVTIIGKDSKGETHTVLTPQPTHPATPKFRLNKLRSESSTSGVASLSSDDEEEEIESRPFQPSNTQVSKTESKEDNSNLRNGKAVITDEDKSDDETIPEPLIPPDKGHIKVPKMSQSLRPEKLDAEAVFEGKKDRYRYDFDATFIRQPRYEFNSIFSPELMSLDLRAIAEREASLELKPTVRKDEATILMRCLEFERLQLATEKVEDSRFSKTRQYIRQKSASSTLSRSRVQSAKSSKVNSKCTADCTQVACVGDCPEKSLLCSSCNKKSCSGCCASQQYVDYTRLTADNNVGKTKKATRPSSCNSCSREISIVKKLNQRQTQLGRPKSSHYTYSQAKKSVRQPLDLRATTQQLDFNESTLDCRPSTAPNSRRGRDSVAPHKSYYSQRRVSLTANTIRPVYGVSVLPTKYRLKSAKHKS